MTEALVFPLYTDESTLEAYADSVYYRGHNGPRIYGMNHRVCSPNDPPGVATLYASDSAMARHVIGPWIKGRADLDAVLANLDKGAARRGSGACIKARYARSILDGPRGAFWLESPERMAGLLAFVRRTCCGCHETGSFCSYGKARRNRDRVRAERARLGEDSPSQATRWRAA